MTCLWFYIYFTGDPELPQRISDIENPFLQQTVTFEELVQVTYSYIKCLLHQMRNI